MSGLFAHSFWLLAQAQGKVPAPGAAAPPEANPLLTLLPFLPVLVLWYFMMIRPQRRQEQVRQTMLSALKKNDRVLTSGGVYGTVVSIDADQDKVVLRVDDDKGVRLTVSRASVVRVLGDPDREKDKTPAAAGTSS